MPSTPRQHPTFTPVLQAAWPPIPAASNLDFPEDSQKLRGIAVRITPAGAAEEMASAIAGVRKSFERVGTVFPQRDVTPWEKRPRQTPVQAAKKIGMS